MFQDQSNLFAAKQIVIDDRGGMLSLDTILEEPYKNIHNDLSGVCMSFHKPSSVSSLVATIDEIRRYTSENSPRYVYHQRSSETPHCVANIERNLLLKRSNLSRSLFSDNVYSNVTFSCDPTEPFSTASNSMVSKEKNSYEQLLLEMTNCIKDSKLNTTPLINAILSDSPILGPKTDNVSCVNSDPIPVEQDSDYVDMNALTFVVRTL